MVSKAGVGIPRRGRESRLKKAAAGRHPRHHIQAIASRRQHARNASSPSDARAGLALSLLFSRALTAGMGVPSFSAPTLVLVALVLLAMTAVAAYVPARRAARLDPFTVLKAD